MAVAGMSCQPCPDPSRGGRRFQQRDDAVRDRMGHGGGLNGGEFRAHGIQRGGELGICLYPGRRDADETDGSGGSRVEGDALGRAFPLPGVRRFHANGSGGRGGPVIDQLHADEVAFAPDEGKVGGEGVGEVVDVLIPEPLLIVQDGGARDETQFHRRRGGGRAAERNALQGGFVRR